MPRAPHLSRAAPVRNFMPDPGSPGRSPGALSAPLKCRACAQLYSRPSNSLDNLRCRAAHLSSAVPSRRPWRANFSERAKKSARLCGEMRFHFWLSKRIALIKRKGRARKNIPNGFSEAPAPAPKALRPCRGRCHTRAGSWQQPPIGNRHRNITRSLSVARTCPNHSP